MKNIIQKIVLIGIMLLVMISWSSLHQKVYAASEADQLTMILDEYKEDMGDIGQFRTVITQLYNDLDSAKTVNDELKTKLTQDVNNLANIGGINPLILNVFDIEFKSQISNLTDETLPEMKEEMRVIKEWADAQISTETPEPTPDNNPEPAPDVDPEPTPDTNTDLEPDRTPEPTPSKPKDNSVINTYIPKAGIRNTIIVIAILVIVIAIIAKNKYGYLKDI